MDANRSIEIINRQTESLQEQINRLEQDNMNLRNELDVQAKEIELCKDYSKVKAVVDENVRLNDAVKAMQKRLDINKEIINNLSLSLESIRRESIPDMDNEYVKELYLQGFSTLRISQLFKTSKSTITNIIIRAGGYLADQMLRTHK